MADLKCPKCGWLLDAMMPRPSADHVFLNGRELFAEPELGTVCGGCGIVVLVSDVPSDAGHLGPEA